MKILVVLGSARREGNTEILIREALKGAGAADVRFHALIETDYSGCKGCAACRAEDPGDNGGCIIDDDMQQLYKDMAECDAWILGSPVYYGEVTGQMKCFMDRWYSLKDHERKLRIPSGKKALFILVQGAPGEGRYAGVASRLEKVLKSYEMRPEILVAPGLEEKGAATESEAIKEKARLAGARLLSRT